MWVVVSAIWLIVVGVLAVYFLPSDRDPLTKKAQATIAAVESFQRREISERSINVAWPNRKFAPWLNDSEAKELLWLEYRAYKTTGPEPREEDLLFLIEGVQDRFRSVDYAPVESAFKENLDARNKRRIKNTGLAFLAWLVPSGLMYLCGVTVAWIIDGFRLNKP